MTNNPVKMTSAGAAAASARLARLRDPVIAHGAVAVTLGRGGAIPESLLPLDAKQPAAVTGPFLVMPPPLPPMQPDGTYIDEYATTDTPPTIFGPVDPSVLPAQHCIAVYYVVYEKSDVANSALGQQASSTAAPVDSTAASAGQSGYYMDNGQLRYGHPRASGPRTGPGAPQAGPSLAAALSGQEIPWPSTIDLTVRVLQAAFLV
jgi:hypothetical protein